MDCRYFDECSAPMCPKDTHAERTSWFADEEICKLKDVPNWVKRQRKIAKTGACYAAGIFTLRMLSHNCICKKGITGIDPELIDLELKEAEKTWFKKHPVKKALSNENKEKFRVQMASVNAMKQRKTGILNRSNV